MESNRHSLDEIDVKILSLLTENARLSARAISRELEMSGGAITERIARLEERGVIEGYRVIINPSAVGYGMFVIVALEVDQGSVVSKHIERLLKISEIEAIHTVTGRWDIVLEVRVRDPEHLREVVLERIWNVPGLRHIETMISLDSRRQSPVWTPRLQED